MKLIHSIIILALTLTINSFAGKTKKICEDSNIEIVKESMQHFPKEISFYHFQNYSKDEILDQWSPYLYDTNSYVPWILMNYPRTDTKEVAHTLQKYFVKKFFMNINPEIDPELDKSFTNFFMNQSQIVTGYSPQYIELMNGKINHIKQHKDNYSKLKKDFDKYSQWICANYLSLGCSSALPSALKLLNPKQNPYMFGGSFSLLEPLRHFLTNPTIAPPLNDAALKIKRILQEARDGRKPKFDLYRTLVDSFRKYGHSFKVSSNLTWEVLGIYSTRGSAINSFLDLIHPENARLFVPLYYISTAINLIDHYMLKDNRNFRTFTLPPGITTSCDYAKPYHFWLTAYLARKLRLSGYSAHASSLTPHILGMMYQFAGIFSDVSKAFYQHKFSPSNNAVRVNMSFNDLGAFFGANLRRKEFHNRLLLNMMRSAKTLTIRNKKRFEEEINQSMLRKYYYWDRVMAPSANFVTLFSNGFLF